MSKVSTLADIYNFQYGKGNTNPDNGGVYPVYGSNGIIGYFDEYNSEDSPVIGHIGANCGSVVFGKGKHYVTYNGVIATIKNGNDARFGYYALLSKNLKLLTRGSAQPFISYDLLNQVGIYLPDISTQQKIAAVLSALDAKIELNQRINAELESMAKTLYDYWFVQFDFPNEKGKPYKSAGGKMVWNEELKREIPLGWEVKSLADITDVGTEQLNPMDFPNKDFKHYSIPAFDETGTYKIEKGEEIKSNKFSIKDTDVLVSKLNPWFSRVIYSTDDEDLISSTEFVVWRTNNIAIKNYLYMIARDYSFIAYCTQSASGTSNSHKRVNPTVMMKYQIVFNNETAEKFGTILGSTIKMYAKNKVESKILTELRDWLLPMLMNGQIKVA